MDSQIVPLNKASLRESLSKSKLIQIASESKEKDSLQKIR